MRRIRERLTYANVMSSIAVFMVLGGSAYAATTLPKNSVGSKQIKSNAVTSSKVKDGSLLSKDFKPGQLVAGAPGATGPAGPAGPAGPKGDTGAKGDKGDKGDDGTPATKLWAVVSSAGAVVRSSGVTSASRLGTGVYQVIFNQDVTNCAFVGAVSDTAFGSPLGFFSASKRGGNANGIFVVTANTAGTDTDEPFQVGIFC